VTVIFLILTLLGAVSFFRLPVDLMPDISLPSISVSTSYSGVGPEEMEELVTIPLERALASCPGLREMNSTSSEGSSQVRLSFEWGTNLDEAANEVRARVDRARRQLPDDADTPTIFKFDVSTDPIVHLGVSSDMDARQLRLFAEKQLQYRFERILGVAQADVWGGLQREIQVFLDREKLNALRLSPREVINALQRENLMEPAGQITEGDFELLVRTLGEFSSVDEIRKTRVALRNGTPVFVSDVATVLDGHQEIRNLVRVNGRPGLRMAIVKQSGANSVAVSRAVREEVERINRDFPNVEVRIIYDTSEFIERAVSNVRDSALYGSLLAVFILLVFLRNIRSTLVIAVSIPISVVATFALMYFYGFTLNTITFGGLALGVGVLVDNAIVVLENIFRHRQEGEEHVDAARTGSQEVALAITASTLTTIVVFIPVVFMKGISGIVFQQLAWVVSFSLFSSLLVALTLVPLLSSRLVRVREPNRSSLLYPVVHGTGVALARLDAMYGRGIAWSLRHRFVVIAATVLLGILVVLLVPFIGFELQPETDEGEVRIRLELAQGTRLEVTDQVAREAERLAREHVPEIAGVITEVGSPGGWRGANTNTANISLSMVPLAQRTRTTMEIADALRLVYAEFAGVVSRTWASGGNFLLHIAQGGGDASRLTLDIRAYDLQQSFATAVELKRLLEETDGVTNVRIGRSRGRPESLIIIDREKAAKMGLSVAELAETINTALGGTRAGFFREKGDEFDILVRFQEKDRMAAPDVQAIPVQTPSGDVVPLGSLVTFERREGPTAITRRDQQRIVSVSGDLTGSRDMGSVVDELQGKIQEMSLPEDMAVIFSGEWEEQQETFGMLRIGFILAIALVYLVMAAQFESFKYPFLIMFSIPLAGIGVILMFFFTRTTFTMQAFIGVIMLAGIAVNNAIVLVDYVLQLWRLHGMSLVDSLVTGGRRRLRPILMTSLTTILGLFPMALGIGEGGELQAPMARALIGGLLTSMLITLFLIPTLFYTMERVKVREEEPVSVSAGMQPAGESA
jgi:HAE1 family hydrophobic/amphiphilic exporter-1